MAESRKRTTYAFQAMLTFPTLPVPTDFQDYAHAYFIGAKELWGKDWERSGTEEYPGQTIWFTRYCSWFITFWSWN